VEHLLGATPDVEFPIAEQISYMGAHVAAQGKHLHVKTWTLETLIEAFHELEPPAVSFEEWLDWHKANGIPTTTYRPRRKRR
jgi:hypothetical protein